MTTDMALQQLTTSVAQVLVGDRLYFAPRGRRPGLFRIITHIVERGKSREFHFDPGNTSLRSGAEVVLVERRMQLLPRREVVA